jgi:hypothetical protein
MKQVRTSFFEKKEPGRRAAKKLLLPRAAGPSSSLRAQRSDPEPCLSVPKALEGSSMKGLNHRRPRKLNRSVLDCFAALAMTDAAP